jgi:hypothetical protein
LPLLEALRRALIAGGLIKRLDALLFVPTWLALALLRGCLMPWRKVDPRPLIVRPGGMGDLVCLHLALERIGIDPAQVRFLIERRARPWAETMRLDFVCYDERPLATLLLLTARHAQVINSEQRFGLAQAYSLACRGRGGRLTAFSTTRGARFADQVVAYDPLDQHEVAAFMRLLVGSDVPCAAPARRAPSDGRLWVLLAGSAAPSRAFDADAWCRFITEAYAEAPFVLAGAPEDAALADQIASRLPQAARLRGGFAEIVHGLARARHLLTVDGGMVHVASYLGIPVTALFTAGRDRKWAPLAAGSLVVARSDLPCRPCTLFGQVPPCPHALACRALPSVPPSAPSSPHLPPAPAP